MKRLIIITSIYSICVFIFSFCIVFFTGTVPNLLPGESGIYRFQQSLVLFCNLFPTVILTSFLISYALLFKEESKNIVMRFSPMIMKLFKKIAIAGLCGTILFVCTTEVVLPLLNKSIIKKENSPRLYEEYIYSARNFFEEENYSISYQYAQIALDLYPDSVEALKIKENCEIQFDLQKKPIKKDLFFIPNVKEELPPVSGNATAYELILRSLVMYEQKDWIDAHYYAMLAQEAAEPGSANESDAKMIAADAWNQLENVTKFENSEVEKLYRQKIKAYWQLMAGDIVDAYYSFSDLAKLYPQDQDILKFYKIAEIRMKSQFFFFDEIPTSKNLESGSNICFYINRPSGGFYVLYYKGVSDVRNTGGMVQYLRDLSVYQYSDDGVYELSFYVPYAKVVAQPLNSLDEESQNFLKNHGVSQSVPIVMLESADREFRIALKQPEFSYATDFPESEKFSNLNYLILPMNFEDFLLMRDISQSPDKMDILSLIKFAGKASEFGYSKEVYVQELCCRICMPILFLALLILTAVFGWNYRLLPKNSFRFIWLFFIPVISVVIYVLFIMLQYVQKLINFGLIEMIGIVAIPFTIICSIIILIVISIVFVSRKK